MMINGDNNAYNQPILYCSLMQFMLSSITWVFADIETYVERGL